MPADAVRNKRIGALRRTRRSGRLARQELSLLGADQALSHCQRRARGAALQGRESHGVFGDKGVALLVGSKKPRAPAARSWGHTLGTARTWAWACRLGIRRDNIKLRRGFQQGAPSRSAHGTYKQINAKQLPFPPNGAEIMTGCAFEMRAPTKFKKTDNVLGWEPRASPAYPSIGREPEDPSGLHALAGAVPAMKCGGTRTAAV